MKTDVIRNSSELIPVRVDLKPRPDGIKRAYKVQIGRGILVEPGLHFFLEKEKLAPPFIIIADKAIVGTNWYSKISEALMQPHRDNIRFKLSTTSLGPGEEAKSWECAGDLLKELEREGIRRSSTIIAIGGGVIGDLAGFVAAIYLRGINFVQIPTTLLAMVDSSVGGKTGINLLDAKNRVGAFHQPKFVLADLETLKTLEAREFSAGMAEVIKYGAIRNEELFNRVSQGVRSDSNDLAEIIRTCVEIKARIVEIDEFETGTERALLNFGHTIGHAIEKAAIERKATKKENPDSTLEDIDYIHGEAVALGMRAAAWISHLHPEVNLPRKAVSEIEAALKVNGLPTQMSPHVNRGVVKSALSGDKKVAADGKTKWVLLEQIGKAVSGKDVSDDLVEKAIDLLYRHPDEPACI